MSIPLRHTLIRASAGSGKTHQLANRYLALLLLQALNGKVAPERIVAITFTRKGAGEFADRILSRLAGAAENAEKLERLRGDLSALLHGDPQRGMTGLAPGAPVGIDAAALQTILAAVIDNFDRLALGTIDSFMARSAQTLAFELGLAGFEILDEPSAKARQTELLTRTFEEAAERDLQAFYQTLKRATLKSASDARWDAGGFVTRYHPLTLAIRDPEGWGGGQFWVSSPGQPDPDWQARARELSDRVAVQDFGIKTLASSLAKTLLWLARRVPGAAGKCASWLEAGGQLQRAWPQWPKGDWVFQYQRGVRTVPRTFAQPLGEILRDWLAAERGAISEKTGAIHQIVADYEALYDRLARRQGRLRFADLPVLLSEAGAGANALRTLGFRWFQKFDHWLLDEFQDTSRAQWEVLHDWLDEALQAEDQSVFVVGDPKQSIFGWRGGEPRLFDELNTGYPGRFDLESLAQSWRSRPAVLALVNQVCDAGLNPALRDPQLFAAAAREQWVYQTHEPAIADPSRPGYAAVLFAAESPANSVDDEGGEPGDDEGADADSGHRLAAQARMIKAALEDGRPVERGLSCAILVRTNAHAQALAQWLRAHDTPGVMVEGDVTLAEQSPLVAAILDALRWLRAPAHTLGFHHLRCSPLWPALARGITAEEAKALPGTIWRRWRLRIAELGAAETTREWCGRLLEANPDDYLQYCAREVCQFAQATGSGVTLTDWIARLEGLTVRENAGAGFVHILTIHRAKGLGYDWVFLPGLDFGTAAGDSLLLRRDARGLPVGCLLSPPAWLRAWVPELADLRAAADAEEDLEALCVLYVALTRAKEACFVILNKHKPRGASKMRDWLIHGVSGAGGPSFAGQPPPFGAGELLWESGDRETLRHPPESAAAAPTITPDPALRLRPPQPRLERRRASEPERAGRAPGAPPAAVSDAQDFGAEVHAIFEQIEWWHPELRLEGASEAVAVVRDCLRNPSALELFTRQSPRDEALREMPLELRQQNTWWSGIADRLVLRRDAGGGIRRACLVDFKTDAVKDAGILRKRYQAQLGIYRQAIQLAFQLEPSSIETILLSTTLKECVPL